MVRLSSQNDSDVTEQVAINQITTVCVDGSEFSRVLRD